MDHLQKTNFQLFTKEIVAQHIVQLSFTSFTSGALANQVQTCLLNLGSSKHYTPHRSSAVPSRPFTFTSPRGPRVQLPVTYFEFHGTTFHLVLVLFASLHQKYGMPHLLTFCSVKQSFDLNVILKTHYFQSAYPAS